MCTYEYPALFLGGQIKSTSSSRVMSASLVNAVFQINSVLTMRPSCSLSEVLPTFLKAESVLATSRFRPSHERAALTTAQLSTEAGGVKQNRGLYCSVGKCLTIPGNKLHE